MKLVVLLLLSIDSTHLNVTTINDVMGDPRHYIDNSTARPIWYFKKMT